MPRAVQVDLLRLVSLLASHLGAAALSLRVTRSFDAARIVTLGCLTAIADALARHTAGTGAEALTDGAGQRAVSRLLGPQESMS